MRIVISEFMDDDAVGALRARHDTVYDATLVDDRDALLRAVGAADALIVRNRTRVDQALVSAASAMKVVGRLGVGLDNIDVAACEARGIAVIPATGANALAVAEYVICTAMMLLRGAYASTPAVAEGRWPRTALSNGREAGGKTLGIVGFGGIGRLAAALASALSMRVVGHDANVRDDDPSWRDARVQPCTLDALLAMSDVITLHVPLVAQTRGLVDAARISRMKPGVILINTSRGGVVDEAAVAEALRSGHLGGAALDVFTEEPLPAGSPLAGCPNLVLTPHIAGITAESNARVSRLIAQRVLDVLAAQR